MSRKTKKKKDKGTLVEKKINELNKHLDAVSLFVEEYKEMSRTNEELEEGLDTVFEDYTKIIIEQDDEIELLSKEIEVFLDIMTGKMIQTYVLTGRGGKRKALKDFVHREAVKRLNEKKD